MVQYKGQHRVKAVVLFQVKYNDLNQCCYTGNWREIYVAKSEGFDDKCRLGNKGSKKAEMKKLFTA